MPETAVHKDGKPQRLENEIWPDVSPSTPYGLMPAPPSDSTAPQSLGKREFCAGVAPRSDPGHHLGAFFSGPDIHGPKAPRLARMVSVSDYSAYSEPSVGGGAG